MAIKFYSKRKAYGCFSNFSPHPVEMDGVVWPTSEHYFQAMKFPKDAGRRERIRREPNPMKAKRIAWEPDAIIRPDWERYRDEVMFEVVLEKFRQHPDIRMILLDTGDEELIEHTRNDRYWGDGGDGTGRNKLGKTLMRVREQLRDDDY